MRKGLQHIVYGLLLVLTLAFNSYADISLSFDTTFEDQAEAVGIIVEAPKALDLFLEDADDKIHIDLFLINADNEKCPYRFVKHAFGVVNRAIVLQTKFLLFLDLPPPSME